MNLSNYIKISSMVALLSISGTLLGASPRINYLLYCTGCHAADGAGKPPNVPTLRDELGRMISVPQMRSYLVRIPGASQAPISDFDLSEVINWLLYEFNSDTLPANFQEYTESEVSTARKNILADPLKYRAEYWKAYNE
tara:strand:- start:120 stop:536 length:417 start_codon:yes stop_codon:yes gene_type:complete